MRSGPNNSTKGGAMNDLRDQTGIQAGVSAIIYLQSLAGYVESPEKARQGWNDMTESERETTLRVCSVLKS